MDNAITYNFYHWHLGWGGEKLRFFMHLNARVEQAHLPYLQSYSQLQKPNILSPSRNTRDFQQLDIDILTEKS